MPTKEFSKIEDLENWLDNYAIPERYAICITSYGEVIVEPLKTSKPIYFGYLPKMTELKLKEAILRFKSKGYQVLELHAYHWDSEQTIRKS